MANSRAPCGADPYRAEPYRAEPGQIGTAGNGTAVTLAAMTPEAAGVLGTGLAAIDPWARVNYSPARLANFFATREDGAQRYQVIVAGHLAGTIVVRNPWLAGPYLNLLGLLPGFSGRGIGHLALSWFEAEARHAKARNIWLCVSSFNTGAERFYRAHGFERSANLADLTSDGFDEILMRKRLA